MARVGKEDDEVMFRDAWMDYPADSLELLVETRNTVQLLDTTLEDYNKFDVPYGNNNSVCQQNGSSSRIIAAAATSDVHVHYNNPEVEGPEIAAALVETPLDSDFEIGDDRNDNHNNNDRPDPSILDHDCKNEDDTTIQTVFDDDDGTVTIRNGGNSNAYTTSTNRNNSHRQNRTNTQTMSSRVSKMTKQNNGGGGNRASNKMPLVGTPCRGSRYHKNLVIHYADSTFIEEIKRNGSAVLIKNGEPPFRKKRECDANSLDAFFGALFCFAMVLTLVVSFGGITSSEDVSLFDEDDAAAVLNATSVPWNNGSNGQQSATPVPNDQRPFGGSFEPMSDFVYPHQDGQLPDLVRPRTEFGHVIDMDGNGDRFVAALRGPDDYQDSYYGGYQVFRWAVSVHDWIWERTLYHEPLGPPRAITSSGAVNGAQLDHQVISMNGNGERIAFTQGGETFLYLGSSGQAIKRFGPASGDVNKGNWHAVSVALSHWGATLAILLSSEAENQPSVLQIYHHENQGSQESGTEGDEESSWELVSQATLSTRAAGGYLSFGYGAGVDLLAVGTFQRDTDGKIVKESIDVYSSIDGIAGTWSPLGYPRSTANSFLPKGEYVGGSTFSLSVDGGALAIGSRGGLRNRVVVLRLDTSGTGTWNAYGTNNVLEGDSMDSNFGAAIHFDQGGKRLFIGAPGTSSSIQNEGASGKIFAYQYDASSDSWLKLCDPIQGQQDNDTQDGFMFGAMFAIDQSGTRVVAGLPQQVEGAKKPGTTGLSVYSGAVVSYHLVD
ncbi:hypothetical protein ACA910_007833 [Epithemia clementina (nom. ined.)]